MSEQKAIHGHLRFRYWLMTKKAKSHDEPDPIPTDSVSDEPDVSIREDYPQQAVESTGNQTAGYTISNPASLAKGGGDIDSDDSAFGRKIKSRQHAKPKTPTDAKPPTPWSRYLPKPSGVLKVSISNAPDLIFKKQHSKPVEKRERLICLDAREHSIEETITWIKAYADNLFAQPEQQVKVIYEPLLVIVADESVVESSFDEWLKEVRVVSTSISREQQQAFWVYRDYLDVQYGKLVSPIPDEEEEWEIERRAD